MVNTREDAQKLVAYTHYAPRGTRSFGPVRASLYGGPDYAQHANETIVAFAMIETAQALDNLDDILSVEGLDAIYIGPSDLSLALGCRPVFDDPDPKAVQAIEHILAARPGARRDRRHPQRRARGGAGAGGEGLPLRHRGFRCAAAGGRLAADPDGHARRLKPGARPRRPWPARPSG